MSGETASNVAVIASACSAAMKLARRKFADKHTSVSEDEVASWSDESFAKYKIPLPTLAEQKKLADKIEKIEAKIAAANAVIASAADKKSAILDKYLR